MKPPLRLAPFGPDIRHLHQPIEPILMLHYSHFGFMSHSTFVVLHKFHAARIFKSHYIYIIVHFYYSPLLSCSFVFMK